VWIGGRQSSRNDTGAEAALMRAWLGVALHPSVCRRATKVALVVGVILALINHGHVLVSGEISARTWLQIGLTFLVPYCVSTLTSVEVIRQIACRNPTDLSNGSRRD
jgi:hypothetical protein